jgi:hypothetical protein
VAGLEPPIFIVGLPRTGSTVWHNLIAMHPQICRLAEARVLGRWGQKDFSHFIENRAGDLADDRNADRLVDLMLSQQQLPGIDGSFWRFEHFQDVIQDAGFRATLRTNIKRGDRKPLSIFRELVEELVRSRGCTRACVKFPGDVSRVPELNAAFPGCRIIHISRDPRAIAMSKTNDPGGMAIIRHRHPLLGPLIRPAAVLFATWQYIRTSRLHRRYCSLPNYRLFLYEDLLLEPARTMKALCEFVGLEYSADKLRLETGRYRLQKSSLTGQQTDTLDARSALRWQDVISPLERRFVTTLTRRSMARFGYCPERHPIFESPQSLDVPSDLVR